jgi:AcrR family transcriptional regulator
MADRIRKRSDGLQTIGLVLRHARAELEVHGPVKFNLDRVIESSGVARSSVYHHFGSRAGLIATLELEHWIDRQAIELDGLRKFLLDADNLDEVFGAIEFVLRIDGGPEGRSRRARRVSSLVAADGIPALAATLRDAQVSGGVHLAETLRMMQEKGTIAPTVDGHGLAYFVQSILIGRVLVDVGDEPGVDDLWVDVVMDTLRHLFAPKG